MSPAVTRLSCRHAIFDFDGTLVDSFGWFAGVINEVAARHRFRQIDETEGIALRAMDPQSILKVLNIPLWKLPAIARELRALKLDAAPGLPLFDGIDDILHLLRDRGVALSIVSSDSEDSVRRTLKPRLASLFDDYDCNASLFGKARKIRHVTQRAGTEPRATIYIGDETRDAIAARRAGVLFGAVTWGYATPEVLETLSPDLVFRRVSEIARIAG